MHQEIPATDPPDGGSGKKATATGTTADDGTTDKSKLSKATYKCPKTTKVADQNKQRWRFLNDDGDRGGIIKRSADRSKRNQWRDERLNARHTFDVGQQSYEQSYQDNYDWRNNNQKTLSFNKKITAAEHTFTLKYLTGLIKKDSNTVIAELATKKIEFQKFLEDIPSDFMTVIVHVLGNVCRANFDDTVSCVLIPSLSNKFLEKLDNYLMRLPYERNIDKLKNKIHHDGIGDFWKDLIDYFKKVIELLPSKACDGLRPILLKIGMIFECVEKFQNCRIDENVKQSALILHEALEAEVKRIEEKNKANRKPIFVTELAEENPPDDFRDLSIIPTFEDMIDDKPYLRKCKITEPYYSVDHYLDVQFRLLREDFVRPLRNGLREYMNPSNEKSRKSDVRIYRNVKLVTPDVHEFIVGITVSFPVMKYVNWRQSKRFMYGGLVILSNDNFKTILFATIAGRNEKDLAMGRILLEPCEGTVITREMYSKRYVMLESKIYFEPYWAVLNAMKHLTDENFPMRRYLLDAESTARLPRYIQDVDSLYYKSCRLPVLYNKDWPDAKDLSLDETQLKAFRSALTQEFSLIQGPPGTGKTFIALEIVSTLLNSKQYWETYGPIIVVCLTNHALDQFLEGILKYTKEIVRFGSRSKSEALKPYTLMERSKVIHKSTAAGHMLFTAKRDMEYILSEIKEILIDIQYFNLPNAIVPVEILKKYCDDIVLNDLQSNENLLCWLMDIDVNSYFNSSSNDEETVQQTVEGTLEPENQFEIIPELEKYHRRSIMDDELDYKQLFEAKQNSQPIFIIENIDITMSKIQRELFNLKHYNKQVENCSEFDLTIMESNLNDRFHILNYSKFFVQNQLKHHSLLNRNCTETDDPCWRNYWYWIKDSHQRAKNRLHELEEDYKQIRLELNNAKELANLNTLREQSVVGLTTSAAAKIYATLQALHAPIVLVEEAAEIFESHVVCSLTKACQQVILIGDHKQLQPKASVYKLGKEYNLNISLFERMVRIMGTCTQLGYQHRMRPAFAKLITPAIYETLHNHEVVYDYPDVKGLEKNLFFLNHLQREENHDVDDSWSNRHEAEFLVAFARHLVLQGYSTDDITILCTYTGQLFMLTKEKNRYSTILQDLRVTTIDNFQGEENKIILLSLVRNNGEGKIGFLREENRVCVALSRAREGFYIMGNIDDLVVQNNIWPKVKSVLEEESAIGDALELRCQIHTDQLIQVKCANDFQQSPEGGCTKMCGIDMPCGHSCLSVCHLRDREHKAFSCRQACLKACINNHPCPQLCYQDCSPCQVEIEGELKCGHTVKMLCSSDPATFPCYIKVEAILPYCNHQIEKLCSRSIESCPCTYPCDSRLLCGHSCKRTCHANSDPDHITYKCLKNCEKTYDGCENNHQCMKKCYENCGLCPKKVNKLRSCEHWYKNAQCGIDLEKELCTKLCKRCIPDCGHKCKLRCYEPCGNCQIMVEKVSVLCGHKVNIKCCDEATPATCTGACPKTLPCGHPCTKKCKDLCTKECQIMIKLKEPGLCGHIFEVPCYLNQYGNPKSENLLKYCKEPCKTKLTCKHDCKGNCGDCYQGRIHVLCGEPCGFPLICGHICDQPCREACKPCNRSCELRCVHNKCKQKCGMPCPPCKEPCTLKCEHNKCKRRCFEICSIEPCEEPCKKKLKCDHPCIGFCGDPCPPLCRICNKDELTELFFGDEDEPDARFIFLEDCNHCVESKGLSKWLQEDNETIKVKTCPKCKTPIKKCVRLMNQIKKSLNDVQLVKQKVFFGEHRDLGKIQKQHFENVKNILNTEKILLDYQEVKEILNKLRDSLSLIRKNRRQLLGAQDIDSRRVIFEIIIHMIKILNSTNKVINTLILETNESRFKLSNLKTKKIIDHRVSYKDYYSSVTHQISMILKSIPETWQLPEQRLADIQLELLRFNYIVKLCNIDFPIRKKSLLMPLYEKKYDLALKKLTRNEPFNKTLEAEVVDAINSLQTEDVLASIERHMIVQAVGYKQGHWYKCPNGHPYVIGECGGAMQVTKCNECGEQIGGRDHVLLATNQPANEMINISSST